MRSRSGVERGFSRLSDRIGGSSLLLPVLRTSPGDHSIPIPEWAKFVLLECIGSGAGGFSNDRPGAGGSANDRIAPIITADPVTGVVGSSGTSLAPSASSITYAGVTISAGGAAITAPSSSGPGKYIGGIGAYNGTPSAAGQSGAPAGQSGGFNNTYKGGGGGAGRLGGRGGGWDSNTTPISPGIGGGGVANANSIRWLGGSGAICATFAETEDELLFILNAHFGVWVP